MKPSTKINIFLICCLILAGIIFYCDYRMFRAAQIKFKQTNLK